MTFYYHFKDIYDLVEWACLEESTRALQGKKTYSTWEEGLLQIFEAVYENKAFIMNAYNSLSREQIENFLFRLTHDLIMGVVEERSVGTSITEAQKNFIADFYKYSFVGILLDWIHQGMKADYTSICTDMCTTLHVHHHSGKYYKFYQKLYKFDRMISFCSFRFFCKLKIIQNGNTM